MTDFIQRLTELTGEDIANKIISEFGGQPVYVRKSIHRASPMVNCAYCAHYIPDERCSQTKFHTNTTHWRICKDFSEVDQMIAMHPADINAALLKAGYNQTKIARELGISPNAVSLVIHGRTISRRVAEFISQILQRPLCQIWPNKYDSTKAA